MNTIIVLLAQTRGVAALEIISMLIVAAIIGYITAWLFYKSSYEKKLKLVESEKHELNNRIVNLNGQIVDLHKELDNKDHEMEVYFLDNIETHTSKLDYDTFGRATKEEKDDLTMISGIGPVIEKRLNSLDIYTFSQISKFTAQDVDFLNNKIIYFKGRIDRDEWVAQAGELVLGAEHRTALFKRISDRKTNINYNRIGTAKREEADDLTKIWGIGGWIKNKLHILDIYTFRQISNFTQEDIQTVTDAIEYFPGRIERDEWIYQARELVKLHKETEG